MTGRPAAVIERRRQAASAGHAGDAAGARIHLDDEDPAVRGSALRGLARAGGLTPADLQAGLQDRSPAVRLAAVELAVNHTDVALDALMARLDDDDRRVVEAAAWAVGETVSASDAEAAAATAATDALSEVAQRHTDPLCRESAVAALGAIGDQRGLRAILAALGDKPEIRRRAVIALAPFDGPEVEAALLKATTDRDRQVRTAAEELRRP